MTKKNKSTTVHKGEETNCSSTQMDIRKLLRKIARSKSKQPSQKKNNEKDEIEEEKKWMSWKLLLPDVCFDHAWELFNPFSKVGEINPKKEQNLNSIISEMNFNDKRNFEIITIHELEN